MPEIEGKGWIGKNNKPKNEASPEYVGAVTIGGRNYRIAGWVRDGKVGKYIALRVSEDDDRARPAKKHGNQGVDDDIPF